MGKVLLLDEHTANKIAAGEVVERPAAVVKELVENSLDAQATKIDIEIVGGGLELIRIVDNGCGLAPEDVELALERHATSKITAAEDLSAIRTMGFRGEALPSIAAVSRFQLLTRRQEDIYGTQITVHGGKTIAVEEMGSPAGTEVRVAELFFNTPARLKFLKSIGSETAKITDTVERLALAWPEVSFRLSVNGKNTLITPGSGQHEDAVVSVLGRQNSRQMLPLAWKSPLVTISGFAAKPSFLRANRNLQYFYVNKRPVRSPLLSDALYGAYHTLLPRNRFPAAVIYLAIDPAEVDINIHPAKREVRFSQERDIYRHMLAAVKSALRDASLIQQVRTWPASAAETAAGLTLKDFGIPELGASAAALPAFSPSHKLTNAYKITFEETTPQADESDLIANPEMPPAVQQQSFPVLTPLGQYRATYILAQSDSGDLFIIDQHAAHERILYEQLKLDLSAGTLPVQEILPQTFELDARSSAALQDNLQFFQEMGLDFETFGNNTFILRSVPILFKDTLRQDELLELLTVINGDDHNTSLFERSLQMMSCKAAVKANHLLDRSEMLALLQKLAAMQKPYTCPHGRPTVMILTEQTVAKNFRRT